VVVHFRKYQVLERENSHQIAMLDRIISYSIQNKLLIGLFVIVLIVWGTYNVTRLPIDAVPDITNNQVQVITVAPSLGATDPIL
jgi:heavy metal efflux system protein